MQPLVDIRIFIKEKEIKQFDSLNISQSIYQHHTFRLICPVESLDGTSGAMFHLSRKLIGAKIEVKDTSDQIKFSGLITQVEAEHYNGHEGDIILSGFGPTILLDNGAHCKSWENQTVEQIISDVLDAFNSNLLKVKITSGYTEKLAYTVQYKETAWQFLSRICATYGDWLFYDGEFLVLGPPAGGKIKLTYGCELEHFNTSMHLQPVNYKMIGFDYFNNEVRKGKPEEIADKTGLDDLGKHAFDVSQKFYGKGPKQWVNYELTDQKQLDDISNTSAALQSSGLVKFDGRSNHPGIHVGGSIHVEGKRFFSSSVNNSSPETIGDYRVVSVRHFFDGQKNYSNHFDAIPLSVKVPPVRILPEPPCETQSALVTDNYDKEGLGRIRVRFHWMKEMEKTPWIRIASPHGGSGSGMYFVPETGDEVLVGFEGSRAVKPYIIGTVYNGKAKTEFGNAGNDVKALQTRSGNKVLMNDKDGSIHVCDAKGNDMMMDGKGNIQVKSSESIVLACGESKIEMKKDGTINITGKKITTTAQESAKMTSGQASFTADGNGNEANMEGMKSNVIGSSDTKIKGGASTEVSAGGNVAVKATLITLN